MVKGKSASQNGTHGGISAEEKESVDVSKRLEELAFSRGMLSRSKAISSVALRASNTIRKCDGKDIVKRGNRKNKYLFSFPGLVAPIAGGKFGELTHLDSKNPIFYIDFPQGRLKLFGTIVYPKNKYLTMQFLPGRGSIACEDCFESIVVFPEAWWIGRKEDNPQEIRLQMPSQIQQAKHETIDFRAGAGRASESVAISEQKGPPSEKDEPGSPEAQFRLGGMQGSQSSMDDLDMDDKPLTLRHSARTAGKKYNYADKVSSGSDANSDGDSESSDFKRKGRRSQDLAEDTVTVSTERDVDVDVLADASKFKATSSASRKTLGLIFEKNTEQVLISANTVGGALKQPTLTALFAKEQLLKMQIEAKQETLSTQGLHTRRRHGSDGDDSVSKAETLDKRLPANDEPNTADVIHLSSQEGSQAKKTPTKRGSGKQKQIVSEQLQESEDEEPSESNEQFSGDSDHLKVRGRQGRVPIAKRISSSTGSKEKLKPRAAAKKKKTVLKVSDDSNDTSDDDWCG